MRLAKHKDAILKKKPKSIREAIKIIPKKEPRGGRDQSDPPTPRPKPTLADELTVTNPPEA